jgi:peptidoglycan/LPS O-acetylase OafA/YrhL
MEKDFDRRVRSIWNVARIFSRMAIEHVAAVWLLGIAPFLAHLAAASPKQGYRWVSNDLYLFIMVIGGTCAMEAFKDRKSTGPLRAIAGIVGFACALGAASAYASLEAGTGLLNTLLRKHVVTIIGVLLGIDLAYRIPKILRDAIHENGSEGG